LQAARHHPERALHFELANRARFSRSMAPMFTSKLSNLRIGDRKIFETNSYYKAIFSVKEISKA